MVRAMFAPAEFLEIYMDTPIEECIRRDPKGLYAKAQAGAISNFTGISSPYEVPEAAEITLRSLGTTPAELADQVLARLRGLGHLV